MADPNADGRRNRAQLNTPMDASPEPGRPTSRGRWKGIPLSKDGCSISFSGAVGDYPGRDIWDSCPRLIEGLRGGGDICFRHFRTVTPISIPNFKNIGRGSSFTRSVPHHTAQLDS